MNNEEKTIVAAFQNGTIKTLAAEYARRNERGFKYGWTVEQHEASLIQKAQSLAAEVAPVAASFNTCLGYNQKSNRPQPGTADYDLFCDHGE